MAHLAGDEIMLAAAVGPHVMGDTEDRIAHTAVTDPEQAMATAMAIHCEAAGMLSSRLGLENEIASALRHGFERWDGKGHPDGLAYQAVPLPIRIAVLARDVLLWHRPGGPTAARDIVMRRRGRAYDPTVVDAYLSSALEVGEVSWPESWLAVERGMCPSLDRVSD